jgi:hypothetical protein
MRELKGRGRERPGALPARRTEEGMEAAFVLAQRAALQQKKVKVKAQVEH